MSNVKPYSDEEIDAIREAVRMYGHNPTAAQWLATLDAVRAEVEQARRERDEFCARANEVPGLTAALDEARMDPASQAVVTELARLATENAGLRAESAALGRMSDADIGYVLQQRNDARAEASTAKREAAEARAALDEGRCQHNATLAGYDVLLHAIGEVCDAAGIPRTAPVPMVRAMGAALTEARRHPVLASSPAIARAVEEPAPAPTDPYEGSEDYHGGKFTPTDGTGTGEVKP